MERGKGRGSKDVYAGEGGGGWQECRRKKNREIRNKKFFFSVGPESADISKNQCAFFIQYKRLLFLGTITYANLDKIVVTDLRVQPNR